VPEAHLPCTPSGPLTPSNAPSANPRLGRRSALAASDGRSSVPGQARGGSDSPYAPVPRGRPTEPADGAKARREGGSVSSEWPSSVEDRMAIPRQSPPVSTEAGNHGPKRMRSASEARRQCGLNPTQAHEQGRMVPRTRPGVQGRQEQTLRVSCPPGWVPSEAECAEAGRAIEGRPRSGRGRWGDGYRPAGGGLRDADEGSGFALAVVGRWSRFQGPAVDFCNGATSGQIT